MNGPIQRMRYHINRFGRRWNGAILFVLGLFLGGILGARYLSQTETAQLFLGTFLPPKPKNCGYVEFQQLKPGMTKNEVQALLKLQRVDLLPEDELAAWKELAETDQSSHAPKDKDAISRICEVWRIPFARTGISSFGYLCFDHNQRLVDKGIDEFMLGFSAHDLPAHDYSARLRFKKQ